MVTALRAANMLPCLYFLPGRRAVEAAASSAAGHLLVTPEDRARLHEQVQQWVRTLPPEDQKLDQVRRLATLLAARPRLPPRRAAARAQGDGGDALRAWRPEGGLRHRYARPGHQHARAHGRRRQPEQVRRPPDAPAHAQRISAAHRTRGPPWHGRARLGGAALLAVGCLRASVRVAHRAAAARHQRLHHSLQHHPQPLASRRLWPIARGSRRNSLREFQRRGSRPGAVAPGRGVRALPEPAQKEEGEPRVRRVEPRRRGGVERDGLRAADDGLLSTRTTS